MKSKKQIEKRLEEWKEMDEGRKCFSFRSKIAELEWVLK